jgi:hypothetical protein
MKMKLTNKSFAGAALITLCFHQVLSLMTTSFPTLRRPHSAVQWPFFRSATRKNAEIRPGSELFPGKGPYVPLGLSGEEYQKIKGEENDKLKRMNFGAWGPRFKRTDRSGGDWMAMPTLWTNGFYARFRPNAQNKSIDGGIELQVGLIRGIIARMASFLSRNGPGFILAYIAVDVVATAYSMWRAAEITARQALWIIARMALFKRHSFFVAALWKMQAAKITIASALTPVMTRYLSRTNHQRLWSKRKTILTTAAGFGFGLGLWAFVLICLGKLTTFI